MKKILFPVILIMGFGLTAIAAENPIAKKVDTKKSSIYWKGQKVTGAHEGTIQIKSGELHFEKDMLVGGTIAIDMTTIACTDLGEKGAERLVGHLKSPDFFNVESHPEASLTITDVVSRGIDGQYKVTADLTIKEITKPIKFNIITENSAMNAELIVDRSEYDVRYGSGSFFDNLGDKTIYDEFELDATVYIEAEQ